MITLETLTQQDINGTMKDRVFQQARSLSNYVRETVRIGDDYLSARIGNSDYTVQIRLVEGALTAECPCGNTRSGFCEHIGAVLLKWINTPAAFAVVQKSAMAELANFPIPATPVLPPATVRPKEPPFWVNYSPAELWKQERDQLNRQLQLLKVQDLRELAKKRGWAIKGIQKADIVDQLISRLTDEAETRKAVNALDAEHRQVWLAMVISGPFFSSTYDDIARIAATWGKLSRYKQITTYTSHLREQGLAVPGSYERSYPPHPDLVPLCISRPLPPVLSDVFPAEKTGMEEKFTELRPAEAFSQLHRSLECLSVFERQPVTLRPPLPRPNVARFFPGLIDWTYDPHELADLIKKQQLRPQTDLSATVPPPAWSLPDETVMRLAPLVDGEARLEFTYHLLVAVGLLQPGSPVTVNTEVKEQFLRQSEALQRAILARAYFRMVNWHELWDVLRAEPDLQLRHSLFWTDSTFQQFCLEVVYFRQMILSVLAFLPHDRWILLADVTPLLQQVWLKFNQAAWGSEFYTSRQHNGNWYLIRKRSGLPLQINDTPDWELGQGNFIRQMLTGPLGWLGLLDVGLKDGRPVAIRLRGLGDLFLDRAESIEPPVYAVNASAAVAPTTAIEIEGMAVMVEPSAIGAQAHALLDKIANLEKVTPRQFTYVINIKSVYAAFEAGETLASVIADWEKFLQNSMPDHLRRQLAEWWQNYGLVRLYRQATVIEFNDDYALAEMKAATALNEHLIAEVSPRMVLIHDYAVPLLVAQLEKAGYTPKQSRQEQD